MPANGSPPVPPTGLPVPGPAVRFGVFEVDFEAGELRKRGLRVRLQEQPFRVLSLLLEQPGRVVTREELQSRLWSGDTFVDFDHGLNTAINKIRQALGDSAANPRFVETMHRRGYRFIAPVELVGTAFGAPAGSTASLAEVESVATPDPVDSGSVPGGAQGSAVAAAGQPIEAQEERAAGMESTGGQATAQWDEAPTQQFPFGGFLKAWGATVFGVTIALSVLAAVLLLVKGMDRVNTFTLSSTEVNSWSADAPPQGSLKHVRILAGQPRPYVNAKEQLWSADWLFVGGSPVERDNVVMGAADPHLFQGERYGSFQYVIPLVPGSYKLMLYFAETYFGAGNPGGGGPGSRIFDVECNGEILLSNFDVYSRAGGSNRSVERSFDGLAPNDQGNIVLTFVAHRNNAMINAIELVPEE